MNYNFSTGTPVFWNAPSNQENFAPEQYPTINYSMAGYVFQQEPTYQWTPNWTDSGYLEQTLPSAPSVSNTWIPNQLEMERPETPPNWKNHPYVTLHAEDWKRFSEVGEPEQLANNDGRRLFPTLHFSISGLDPDSEYDVSLQITCVSEEQCFDEETKEWKQKTRGLKKIDVPKLSNEFMTVSRTGAEWMAEGIDLSEAKLYTIGARTIKKELKPGMIRVYPLHRYVPKLKISEKVEGAARMVHEEAFEGATFVAVSRVKNQHINRLRTQENTRSRYRVKHTQ